MEYCLGTVQFGMDYGIQGASKLNKTDIFGILTYAIDKGVRCFDTASAYGQAEEILGEYIKALTDNNEKIHIISKLEADALKNIPEANWCKVVEKNATISLSKLGIRKFNAYLFHNASFLYNKEAVKALAHLKEKGLADKVGASIYEPREALEAFKNKDIEVLQIPYNVLDTRWEKIGFFERAQQQNISVFARSTLLQGLLMMEPSTLPHNVRFAKKYLLRFRDICNKYGVSPLNAAVKYVASKPSIDYIVFGVDRLEQLKEYINAQKHEIPSAMVSELNSSFKDVEELVVNPTLWK